MCWMTEMKSDERLKWIKLYGRGSTDRVLHKPDSNQPPNKTEEQKVLIELCDGMEKHMYMKNMPTCLESPLHKH